MRSSRLGLHELEHVVCPLELLHTSRRAASPAPGLAVPDPASVRLAGPVAAARARRARIDRRSQRQLDLVRVRRGAQQRVALPVWLALDHALVDHRLQVAPRHYVSAFLCRDDRPHAGLEFTGRHCSPYPLVARGRLAFRACVQLAAVVDPRGARRLAWRL